MAAPHFVAHPTPVEVGILAHLASFRILSVSESAIFTGEPEIANG